ncbi:MAG: nitroreductase family protein, partial [Muribaculaceae bacterium]|nr:nitroreductase family protein [Muribaculaceae bacterium]
SSTIEDIMTRTSVRSYSDKKVAKETVDTLLRAAMAAPTAMNKQPWRFVVIEKRELLDSIAAKFKSMTMAAKAPLAVVMCGDMTAAIEGEGREYWVQDVSAASENLLLAAHAVGLGAVWCGIYPIAERVNDFSKMLELPENIVPMACICIGYPEGINQPKDKWKPEYVHYNSWQ